MVQRPSDYIKGKIAAYSQERAMLKKIEQEAYAKEAGKVRAAKLAGKIRAARLAGRAKAKGGGTFGSLTKGLGSLGSADFSGMITGTEQAPQRGKKAKKSNGQQMADILW